MMKRLFVAYGTQEGHTARIAFHVGRIAQENGYEVGVQLCRELPPDFNVGAYDAVVIAAPVHDRKHDGSVLGFIRQHRAALESVPTAFLSVGLVPVLPRFVRRKAAAGVLATLFEETGWRPANALVVAGAIMYRKYTCRQRLLFRLVMALLSGPTDTSRDHDLTDWSALRQFTLEFLATVREHGATGRSRPHQLLADSRP
jgi:menaquinone-dependent protoporphyrinogen oxidase